MSDPRPSVDLLPPAIRAELETMIVEQRTGVFSVMFNVGEPLRCKVEYHIVEPGKNSRG